MKVDVALMSAFSVGGAGGNPAGVVLQSDVLSDDDKLKISQEIGYSETAFVANDDEVDFHVSFFTTTGEVDFCGHATLATFSLLYQRGILTHGTYVQRTKAGLLNVTIEPNGHVVMDQALPQYLKTFSYQEIAPLLGLDEAVLAKTNLPIEVISTGLHDMIVPIPNKYLDKIVVDERQLSHFCAKHHLVGIHAFELCDVTNDLSASCRNFAPLVGISEESATGSANGALACYLVKHLDGSESNHFIFEQGRAMNCTSIIHASVQVEGQQVTAIKVGGAAHSIGERQVIL